MTDVHARRNRRKSPYIFGISPSRIAVALALITLLGASVSQAESTWNPHKVVDANTCAECHESSVEVWRNTKHFATYGELHRGKRAKEIADAMGIAVSAIRRAESECANCHYTTGIENNRERVVAGISCQSCHGPAADWLEIHNDYGGPGVKKESESAAHKAERYKAMHAAGMVYPADLYGLANNCFQCHLIANEALVNKSDHPTSSEFDLVERSQGDIRHYPAADQAKRNKLAIAGIAAQTVQGLRALAGATPGTRFASEMETTVQQAASQFSALAGQLDDASLKRISGLLQGAPLKAGNAQLAGLAAQIDSAAVAMVGVGGSVSDSKAVAAVRVSTPKAKAAPKPAPRPEPKAEPRPAPEGGPALKPEPRPTPKTQPKPTVVADDPLQTVLLHQFLLQQPRSTAFCQSLAPWSRGARTVSLAEVGGHCFGMTIDKAEQTSLHLFLLSTDDKLVKLLPNNCSFLGVSQLAVARGSEVKLPVNANNQPSVLKLEDPVKALYAVVASDDKAHLLIDLAESVPDICAPARTGGADFEEKLKALNKRSLNHVQWRKIQ